MPSPLSYSREIVNIDLILERVVRETYIYLKKVRVA